MTHLLAAATAAALALAPAYGSATTAGRSPDPRAEAPAAGPLETIDSSTVEGWRPVMVTDRHGTTTVVWDRVGQGRYAAQRTSGGTWTTPVLLGCTGAYTCGATVLGVDRSGTVTAAWDVNAGSRPDVEVLTRTTTGTWSVPVTVTGPRGREHGYEPRLDVAPDGAAVLSFQALAGGEVVLRKPATRSWSHPLVRRFADLDTSNGVAIGRDGRVVVVGEHDVPGSPTRAVAHVFRPGAGWLPSRTLGLEGGDTELAYLDMGANGSAAVAWTTGTRNHLRSAVVVRRMDLHYRWDRATVISPWFGQDHPAFITDVAVGPRSTATVIWSGRTHKASTRLTSGTWVTRRPIPDGAGLHYGSYSSNRSGDAAVPWYTTTQVDPASTAEQVRVSVRDHPSLAWRRSGVLGTSSCGTGERGDPGCRPFAVSALPDGSVLVSWFDLTNALVARVVR